MTDVDPDVLTPDDENPLEPDVDESENPDLAPDGERPDEGDGDAT